MKKKVIFGALAAPFLGGGIVTTVNLTQKEQVSDLALDNIEAMTWDRDENGSQKGYDCLGWWTGRGFRCAAEINTSCNAITCK